MAVQLVDARACGTVERRGGLGPDDHPEQRQSPRLRRASLRLPRPSARELVVFQRKPRPGVVDIEERDSTRRDDDRRWVTAANGGGPNVLHAPHSEGERLTALVRGAGRSACAPSRRDSSARSYTPGAAARLQGRRRPGTVRLDILDAATGVGYLGARIVHGAVVGVRVGRWSPGVYAARLTDGDRVTQAPLVVRASASSRPRVAVVLPSSTWQAYNFSDRDGDGTGDTWYASRRRESARLDRPFMGNGMPPFFHQYDRPFLRWLRTSGHDADVLGDDDLDRVPMRDPRPPLRPARLPRAPRVRDAPRAGSDRAVPRPRRQPRLPQRRQPGTGVSSATGTCCGERSNGAPSRIHGPRRRSSVFSIGRATTAHTAARTW